MIPNLDSYDLGTLLAFLRNISAARSLDEAMHALHWAGSSLSLPHVDYAFMPSARCIDGTWVSPQMTTCNFPYQWDRRYDRHRPHDPYFHASYNQSRIVNWDTVQQSRHQLCNREQDCMDYITDAGLVHGLTVPIHMAAGTRFSFISFLGSSNVAATCAQDKIVHNTVFMIAHSFHQEVQRRFQLDIPDRSGSLSDRETQCLYWVARGHTINDVATILTLSPETVRVYIKRAMNKLSALNRTHAVAKAISLGIIDHPPATRIN